jgi:hypothetical protein
MVAEMHKKPFYCVQEGSVSCSTQNVTLSYPEVGSRNLFESIDMYIYELN